MWDSINIPSNEDLIKTINQSNLSNENRKQLMNILAIMDAEQRDWESINMREPEQEILDVYIPHSFRSAVKKKEHEAMQYMEYIYDLVCHNWWWLTHDYSKLIIPAGTSLEKRFKLMNCIHEIQEKYVDSNVVTTYDESIPVQIPQKFITACSKKNTKAIALCDALRELTLHKWGLKNNFMYVDIPQGTPIANRFRIINIINEIQASYSNTSPRVP